MPGLPRAKCAALRAKSTVRHLLYARCTFRAGTHDAQRLQEHVRRRKNALRTHMSVQPNRRMHMPQESWGAQSPQEHRARSSRFSTPRPRRVRAKSPTRRRRPSRQSRQLHVGARRSVRPPSVRLPSVRLPSVRPPSARPPSADGQAQHREAEHGEAQHGKAQHREAQHRKAQHRKAQHREAQHREAPDGQALGGEAEHGQAEHREAPAGQAFGGEAEHGKRSTASGARRSAGPPSVRRRSGAPQSAARPSGAPPSAPPRSAGP